MQVIIVFKIRTMLLTLGFVMISNCFVGNDKVDAVEQCHDEWGQNTIYSY